MLIFKNLDGNNYRDVAKLETECFGADAWSENLIKNEIGDENKHYFLLYEDERLVAYGGFAQIFDEGHINNIAVVADSRRKGFGKAVLQKFFDSVKTLRINAFTLEVRESNIPAISLYEGAGFVCEGVRKKYYRDGESARIYWKRDF